MSASKLVKPSVEFKDSYIEAIKEFHQENRYVHIKTADLVDHFDHYIDDLNNRRVHQHRPFSDWVEPVPETVLWLVKDLEFIGTFNIRHRLNWHLEKWGGNINFLIRPSMRGKGYGKKILQKGMPFCCYLGIERALITVAPEKESAIHIIESCGGVYEETTPQTEQFPSRKRYWLECI